MSRIAAVQPVLPEHRYSQGELTAAISDLLGAEGATRRVVDRVHGSCGVDSRHIALPLDRYPGLSTFDDANGAFIEAATELGARALTGALEQAGLAPEDVDLVVATTITGIAVPSLDALVAARVGLRRDVRRVPVLGLGCAGGAGGLGILGELLDTRPGAVGALVSVELCSLTIQRGDTSTANIVASGLFGDGGAAVVAVGEDHAAGGSTRIVGSGSRLYPGTSDILGWDVGAGGLRIVLGAEVPGLVREHVGADVDEFLAGYGLARDDVGWWVCHPGGPKVLDALADSLELDRSALEVTWDHLARVGNLSSSSVLHVLADTLATAPPPAGSVGVVLAMGPGFGLEMVLLRA